MVLHSESIWAVGAGALPEFLSSLKYAMGLGDIDVSRD